MALFRSSIVRNRVLSLMTSDDFALLEPMLERVPLPLRLTLVEANRSIQHVYFPESGMSSTVAETPGVHLGMLAHEVALLHPEAVWTDPADGWARVDYERAVA